MKVLSLDQPIIPLVSPLIHFLIHCDTMPMKDQVLQVPGLNRRGLGSSGLSHSRYNINPNKGKERKCGWCYDWSSHSSFIQRNQWQVNAPSMTVIHSFIHRNSGRKRWEGSVCKVRTQDPENFDEEVKSLVTARRPLHLRVALSS